jgi:regulator of CtrA degradation
MRTMPETSPLGLFVGAIYGETLRLLEELAGFIASERGPELAELTPPARALLARETSRMTHELLHVMAWLLMEKAVAAGEVGTADRERLDAYRLRPLEDPHPPLADLRDLPLAARGLIDRCRRLHGRALEVERLIREHRTGARDSTGSGPG